MADEGVHRSVMWRTVFTVVVGLGWLVWLLLWWAFWSEDLEVARKFAVAIVSAMVLGGLTAAVWIPYSMRWAPEEERRQWRVEGFRARVVGSTFVFVALAVLVVYWLWFPGKDYDICQSFVIIIVVLIAGVALMAPMWMRWGMRTRFTGGGVVLDGVADEASEANGDADDAMREDDD